MDVIALSSTPVLNRGRRYCREREEPKKKVEKSCVAELELQQMVCNDLHFRAILRTFHPPRPIDNLVRDMRIVC